MNISLSFRRKFINNIYYPLITAKKKEYIQTNAQNQQLQDNVKDNNLLLRRLILVECIKYHYKLIRDNSSKSDPLNYVIEEKLRVVQ